MVFKLAREAERRCRRRNGYEMTAKVSRGVGFEDGVRRARGLLLRLELTGGDNAHQRRAA